MIYETVLLTATSPSAMVETKDVLVFVVTGILAGSSLGILTPPKWVQAILALAIYMVMR